MLSVRGISATFADGGVVVKPPDEGTTQEPHRVSSYIDGPCPQTDKKGSY